MAPSDERAGGRAGGRAERRGGAPRPGSGPAPADADELSQKLAELYKEMPRDELERQGREHLANDTRQRVKRSVHMGWVVCWTMILGGLILIGMFSLWLLFMAKKNGTSFAHMREQAMSAYTSDE
jgi:hypothetical protein